MCEMQFAGMALRSHIEALIPEMRAYAAAICVRPEDEAEDLVQDAIERALRFENPPSRRNELRPWVIRIIRNLHYDELRKRRVRREYSATEERLSSNSSSGTTIDRDILVRLAFEKLAPSHREILNLVDVLEFKYSEAAQLLNVPKGTIMSRVSRARKALLDLVDGDGSMQSKDLD